MRSDIRKRLGRTLAGVATVVSTAALSAVYGGVAVAEETPSPAPGISVSAPGINLQAGEAQPQANEAPSPSAQGESPSPSTQDEEESDVSVGVDISGTGPAFNGTVKVTVTGDDAENVHLSIKKTGADVTLGSTPSGWNCDTSGATIECDADKLSAGTYSFKFTGLVLSPKPGKTVTISATVTSDNDSNDNNNAASDSYTVGPDFGATLSGRVWKDTNKNGQQDSGEAGIPGITVQAFDGETPLKSATTGGSGGYSLSGIAGDDVSLTISGYGDLVFTTPNKGSDVSDSDANANGVIEVGEVSDGDDRSYDAGLHAKGGGGGEPGPTTPAPSTGGPTTGVPSGSPSGRPTTPGATKPGTTTAPVVTTPGTSTKPPAKLPKTGAAIGGTLAAGAALMAGGAALSMVARRRREENEGTAS